MNFATRCSLSLKAVPQRFPLHLQYNLHKHYQIALIFVFLMSKKKVTLDRTAKKLIKLTLNEQTIFAEFDLNIYLLVPEKYAVN